MLPLRVTLMSLLLAANTVLHVVPLLAVAVVKALLPFDRLRKASNPALAGLAESWIGVNNRMLDRLLGTRVDVQQDVVPRKDGHYLVLANHQSWVDIVVLQKVFNRRIPLLRFFLKRQLFWVPLLGLAWWALDFPFMGRHTPKQIARRPELAGRDINELHVEAGYRLNGSLLREDCVDELLVYLAPTLLGNATGMADLLPPDTLAAAPRLWLQAVDRVGDDVRLLARLPDRLPARPTAGASELHPDSRAGAE